RWLARQPITDGQSGYRAFCPAAAGAAEVIHDYNYAQVLTLDLLAKGFVYGEVPIRYSFRESGTSFVRLGRYLRKVIPAVYRELNATAPDRSPAVASVPLTRSFDGCPRTAGCMARPQRALVVELRGRARTRPGAGGTGQT